MVNKFIRSKNNTDNEVSVICACKNRYEALKVSLISWLNFDEIKKNFNLPKENVTSNYDEIFDNPEIDIVYILPLAYSDKIIEQYYNLSFELSLLGL